MGRLDGKVAIITGGNSGIGAVSAVQFAKEGDTILVMGARDPSLSAFAKNLGEELSK